MTDWIREPLPVGETTDTSAHTAVSTDVPLHWMLVSKTHLPNTWDIFLACMLQAGMESCSMWAMVSPGQMSTLRPGRTGGPGLRTWACQKTKLVMIGII